MRKLTWYEMNRLCSSCVGCENLEAEFEQCKCEEAMEEEDY